MSKSQGITQKDNTPPRSIVVVWLAIVFTALIAVYGLWNINIAMRDTDKLTQTVMSLNEARAKHEKAILELKECYNQKTTCTIDAKDLEISN